MVYALQIFIQRGGRTPNASPINPCAIGGKLAVFPLSVWVSRLPFNLPSAVVRAAMPAPEFVLGAGCIQCLRCRQLLRAVAVNRRWRWSVVHAGPRTGPDGGGEVFGLPVAGKIARAGLVAALAVSARWAGVIPGVMAARAVDKAAGPAGRERASFAHDPALHEIVLFAGDSGRAVLGNTWVHAHRGWVRQHLVHSPSPRPASCCCSAAARRPGPEENPLPARGCGPAGTGAS